MYSIAKCIEMRQKRVWVWVLAIIGGIPWGYLVMGVYLPAHIGYSALGKTEPEYFAARKWYTQLIVIIDVLTNPILWVMWIIFYILGSMLGFADMTDRVVNKIKTW